MIKLLLEKVDNASLMTLLTYFQVKKREEQPEENWVLFFSPWHKGENRILRVSKGHRLGGNYASPRWEVSHDAGEYQGYGAISLVAKLIGVENNLGNRKEICRQIAAICQLEIPGLEDEHKNGLCHLSVGSPDFRLTIQEDFSLEALEYLGCKAVRLYEEKSNGQRVPKEEDGRAMFRFSFGYQFNENTNAQSSNFDVDRLHREFGLYEVKGYVSRNFWHKKELVSRVCNSHAFFPVFAFIQGSLSEKENCCWGEIYQPEWCGEAGRGGEGPRFRFYTKGVDYTVFNHHITGDQVVVRMLNGEFAQDAVRAVETNETLVTTKLVEIVNEKGKKEKIEAAMEKQEVKLSRTVICRDALEAVRTYFALNSLARTYYYQSDINDLFFHVIWHVGNKEYGQFEVSQIQRITTEHYLLFERSAEGALCSFRFCRISPQTRLASLPVRLPELFKVSRGGREIPATDIRSFFEVYQMDEMEELSYGNDLNLLFLSYFTSALPVNPYTYKMVGKNGEVPTKEYRVDTACLWQLMAVEGFCREVQSNSSDMVGRYIRRTGCFVQEIEPKSVVVAAQGILRNYAQRWGMGVGDDYRKMLNAANACRDLNESKATNLPVVELDFKKGYGPKLDYFFYRNGALRITPDEITFVPYSRIDFCVDKGELLDFDFKMPKVSGKEQPFRIYENPEYQERMEALKAHRSDAEHYTRIQIEEEERALQQWAQTNRWKFDFGGKPMEEWWEPLQVLRCFANEEYEEEMELNRNGESFSEEQEKALQARMANILYSLGRPLFRYRGGGSSYMPYITENRNSLNDRAEGGSGKSLFVNVFMGCSGKIYRVNSRNLRPDSDIALSLDGFEFRHHRVVHWEDWPNGLKIDPLYNYVTSGFEFRHRHKDSIRVSLSESPGHVISSNYQQTYDDPSSSGRVVPTGFSHFFNRGDVRKNKPERKVSYVMPGLRDEPKDMDIELRSQIAYINAMAVQFCMKVDSRVLPPMGDLNERSQKKAMGDIFILWAKEFFSHDYVFLCPIDLKTIFSEYVELCDTSDDKKNKFSASTFRKKVLEYCADNSFVCNPDACLDSETERRNRYMRVKAWCKTVYFDDENVWGPGKRKEVRELRQSQQCMFFVRSEAEAKKLTPAQVDELCKAYYAQPDPSPCIDPETNEPYVLTEEERLDWEIYMLKKQGNYAKAKKLENQREGVVAAEAAISSIVAKGEAKPNEELPF